MYCDPRFSWSDGFWGLLRMVMGRRFFGKLFSIQHAMAAQPIFYKAINI